MKKSVLVLAALVVVSQAASAEETTTIKESNSVSTSVRGIRNGKFEDTHVLTDSKLKADDGSLSRWSFKGSFSYYGPTAGNLSAADQPNPSGKAGNYSQRLKGAISSRYRINGVRAISFGTGMTLNHPFHGMDRTDVNNPFMTYDMAARLGNLQLRSSPGFTIATVPDYTKIGEVGGLTWGNSMVYNVGTSGFALSFDANFSWWLFNRPSDKLDKASEEYSLMWIPGAKYNFSDSTNIYTSLGFMLFNPHKDPNKSIIWNDLPTWQVGMSYAYGRSMYIAPYVQTYTNQITADSTTLNISTTFSLM